MGRVRVVVVGVTAALALAACSFIVPIAAYDEETRRGDAAVDGAICGPVQTDALNCGACERDCRGTVCTSGQCQPVAIITSQKETPLLGLAPGYLYWALPSGRVMRAASETFRPHELVATTTGTILQLRAHGDRMYWVSNNAGVFALGMQHVSGGAPREIALPEQMTIADADDTTLFLVDGFGNVLSLPRTLDGAPTRVPLPKKVFGLVVDGDHLFVTAYPKSVFDSDPAPNLIQRATKDGREVVDVISTVKSFTLAVDGDSVYWADIGPTAGIWKVAKAGGEPSLVLARSDDIYLGAARNGFLRFISLVKPSDGGAEVLLRGNLWRVKTDGRFPVALFEETTFAAISTEDPWVYWSSSGTIFRVGN